MGLLMELHETPENPYDAPPGSPHGSPYDAP